MTYLIFVVFLSVETPINTQNVWLIAQCIVSLQFFSFFRWGGRQIAHHSEHTFHALLSGGDRKELHKNQRTHTARNKTSGHNGPSAEAWSP